MTRETVISLTPASLATSASVNVDCRNPRRALKRASPIVPRYSDKFSHRRLDYNCPPIDIVKMLALSEHSQARTRCLASVAPISEGVCDPYLPPTMMAGLIGGDVFVALRSTIRSVLQIQDAVRRIVFGLIILGMPLAPLGRKR
ncbi:hypothetical protein [Methylocapsa sp. S129]|uniref:hypothetical protein n=1 Tax=Methylocapsa sp. S129 TaxID=1641869 RepID=UPI00157717A3|nr:hypothetical protein [Methylocapsa sp. S129]